MTTVDENAIARAVDELLTVAGMTVNETEREYFIRAYPVLRESLRHLRIPEARDAEPALIYSADDRR